MSLAAGLLAADLLAAARRAGKRVTCAESCTGGMVAAAITDPPGASDIFDCGFVTYSNQTKQDLLGVRAATLEAHGAVSEPVAREMAQGALRRAGADAAVSISGIAGPGGGNAEKPEGRVCFAIATGASTTCETVDFGALGRDRVRAAARDHALGLLLRALHSN
ncbi:MAG: CinA family protein [Marinovum algicola]|jgi:nicotinamide-nucleotide amidase|uniref:Nicotinamide-nucleotide amidase n=1 Tax=Marinovum algicola TaxID=42444 RepID=A0A975ZLW0_9RHOB|nr:MULTISPECIES: CinA family protein [Marinovum]MDD9739100.1 CinA family protein [Marinovum sp. SP66]MDD9744119.1 CinA family protein [Marinovum sp. PR37]SEI79262.1 nicotinamide-nucleotide amidase [Marinovum algicola]SLN17633.1 Nicotinamide-nucleotide amidohydrolase PncC [Marinovum algicola]